MVSIGIDLGGTNIAAGIVDEAGNILASGSVRTLPQRPYQDVVKDMADISLHTLRKLNLSQSDVRSVGIGIPGVADQGTGEVIFCTNLGWHNVPLRDEMQKYINKPVYIDNDANVAALAESIAGVSAGTQTSVFLTLGTGVGAGIMINGQLWNGCHGVAAEIGHLTLVADGEPCTCGKSGCLERYCSATALGRMGRQALAEHPDSMLQAMSGGQPERVNAKTVLDAAKAGDAAAMAVFRHYVKYLSLAVNTIISFIDPEIVVLGGGVSKAGDFLADAVRAEIPHYLMYKTLPYAGIEIAGLGSDAGIIGAAMLGRKE